MNRTIAIFFVVALSIFPFIFISKLTPQQSITKVSSDFYYASGKIVIQFSKEVSPIIPWKVYGIIQTGIWEIDQLCWRFKVHTMRRQFPAPKYLKPDLTRHFVVRFDESMNLDEMVEAFSKISYIEKVQKVGVHKYLGNPNDNDFNYQWNMTKIHAPQGWNIQLGSDSVILAIADSGVGYTHSDLNDNIWINLGEYGGQDDYDDDGNGFKDDIYGWDFDCDQENCYPNGDPNPSDTYGHGTHVAGIAAAETNNYIGVAGLAGGWSGQEGCRIMCLCIGHEGADMSCAAEAFYYATDMGAIAINCSWPSSDTGGLADAVDYAVQNGVLIVVAAGNSNLDDPDYLCAREDCMAVAATDKDDEKASYSNYGEWVEVAAPGGDGESIWRIYSTLPSGYGWLKGTSQAAPHVTGLAGLIKSENSYLGRAKIWEIIEETTDNIGIPELGSGRINVYEALKQSTTPIKPTNLNAEPIEWNEIKLSWKDNSDNENGFKIERKTGTSEFSEIASLEENVTSYNDNNVLAETTYYYRVKAYNLAGDSDYSNEASATTPPIPPAAPSNLLAYGYCWEVKLTWQDNSDNEDGFKIYRRSGTEYYYLAWVGPNVTTYWDIELYCGQHWCYKVRAFRNGSNSPFSNAACDWTEPCYQCGYPMSLKIVPDKETINLDEAVTYSYVIENKGNVDLTDIELIDDKFGIIATKFALKKGEAKDFIITITLTESTTNCVEATALWHYENKSGSIKTHACATVEVRK